MARRMLGGVCAGIARTYDYDITVVRVVALLLALPGGFGLVLYAALWVLMPADTGTPQPSTAAPVSSAEELAERIRLAADEFAAATRAAAYATRVAAEQLSEVARAASAAGRESWEARPSAQAAAAADAPTAPASPVAPEAPATPEAPVAPSTPTSTPPA
jgi:phage shock protein PspC (stress-responsive transcriptional regulator)